jgi:hypothetical protein
MSKIPTNCAVSFSDLFDRLHEYQGFEKYLEDLPIQSVLMQRK